MWQSFSTCCSNCSAALTEFWLNRTNAYTNTLRLSALGFVSHVYSNTGVQAPVYDIVAMSKLTNSLSTVDVAQSAGVIPLDLSVLDADFMIG